MLKRTVVIFWVMFLVWIVDTPKQTARAEGAPILLTFGRDQWAWNTNSTSAKQLTQSGVNYEAILSPNTKYLAYKSDAQFIVDRSKEGTGGGDGEQASDIWLLEMVSNTTRRIAVQPPNTSENFILRSTPTWSPDGQSLAWTELVFTGHQRTNRLVIYSLKTGKTRQIRMDRPTQEGVGGPAALSIRWGTQGLAIFDYYQSPPQFYIYSEKGFILLDIEVYFDWVSSPGFTWLADGDKVYLAIVVPSNSQVQGSAMNWFLLDPKTATFNPLNGIAELYSLSAPAGLSIYATANEKNQAVWYIADRHGDLAVIDESINSYGLFTNLAIAPDGKQVAYLTIKDFRNPIYQILVNDGKGGRTTLPQPKQTNYAPSIVWGTTGWRVRRVSAPAPK